MRTGIDTSAATGLSQLTEPMSAILRHSRVDTPSQSLASDRDPLVTVIWEMSFWTDGHSLDGCREWVIRGWSVDEGSESRLRAVSGTSVALVTTISNWPSLKPEQQLTYYISKSNKERRYKLICHTFTYGYEYLITKL